MSGFDGRTVRLRKTFKVFQTLPLHGSFPKTRGTFLGSPIIMIIVFGGLYWGPLIALKFDLPGPAHLQLAMLARILGFRV